VTFFPWAKRDYGTSIKKVMFNLFTRWLIRWTLTEGEGSVQL